MKSIVHTVAFAIHKDDDPNKILLVRRSSNDPDLSDVWGLPAGTLKPNETHQDALCRSGLEKLGIAIVPTRFLNRGAIERDNKILQMELYEAKIVGGIPKAHQPFKQVSQYTDVMYEKPQGLHAAAKQGSLCSQLYLEAQTTT